MLNLSLVAQYYVKDVLKEKVGCMDLTRKIKEGERGSQSGPILYRIGIAIGIAAEVTGNEDIRT
jgi:hypothetical protein